MENQSGIGGACERNPDYRGPRRSRVVIEEDQPEASGSWCLFDPRGTSNCGFESFEQCMEKRAGIGGTCQRNTN